MPTNLIQNNTLPVLDFTVYNSAGGTVDLSTATVNFYFRQVNSTTLANSGHTACTPVDAGNGVMRYSWAGTDLAVAGDYEGELEVTFASEDIQSIYEIYEFNVRPEFNPDPPE